MSKVIRIDESPYEVLEAERDKTGASIQWLAGKAINEYFRAKPKQPEKKVKKTHPDHQPIKEAFFDAWKINNGFDVTAWGPAQSSAVNGIIRQLTTINTKDSSNVDLFRFIMNNLPKWFKDKSITVINSKFYEIIAQLGTERAAHKTVSGGKFDFTS